MNSFRRFVESLRALLTFFTTLPLGMVSVKSAAEGFYLIPLVGAVEGLIIGFALYLMMLVIGQQLLVASLYMLLHVLLTGGIHLDGYADYADVIGSHKTGLEALKVLKDPRKGAFAITYVALNIAISIASMSTLLKYFTSLGKALASMYMVYLLSAESMFILAVIGASEPYEGLSKMFSSNAKKLRSIVINIVITILLLIPLTLYCNILSIAIVATTTVIIPFLVVLDAHKRLGFVNGDVLGFCYEVTRVADLVVLSVVRGL
ncbi:MAG: adenosylcobinamide-GDP ribazoletransferase [Ignisphaera sp.]|nr:adenosylcobinamide-GDP ribazoletransferase [Ignisphaera sp.]